MKYQEAGIPDVCRKVKGDGSSQEAGWCMGFWIRISVISFHENLWRKYIQPRLMVELLRSEFMCAIYLDHEQVIIQQTSQKDVA